MIIYNTVITFVNESFSKDSLRLRMTTDKEPTIWDIGNCLETHGYSTEETRLINHVTTTSCAAPSVPLIDVLGYLRTPNKQDWQTFAGMPVDSLINTKNDDYVFFFSGEQGLTAEFYDDEGHAWSFGYNGKGWVSA